MAPLSAPSLVVPVFAPAPAALAAAALPVAAAIPAEALAAAAVPALVAAGAAPSGGAAKEDDPRDPGRTMFDQAASLSSAEDDLERRRIQRLGHAQAADPDLLIARMDGESKGTALPLGMTGRAQQGKTPTCAACGLTNACGLPDSAAESINALLRRGDPDRPVRGEDLMRLASGPPFNGRAVTRDEIPEVVAKLRKPVVVVLDFGGKTAHVVVVDGYFQARGRSYVSINDSQVGYRLFMTEEQFQRLAPNSGEGPRGGLYFPAPVAAREVGSLAVQRAPESTSRESALGESPVERAKAIWDERIAPKLDKSGVNARTSELFQAYLQAGDYSAIRANLSSTRKQVESHPRINRLLRRSSPVDDLEAALPRDQSETAAKANRPDGFPSRRVYFDWLRRQVGAGVISGYYARIMIGRLPDYSSSPEAQAEMGSYPGR